MIAHVLLILIGLLSLAMVVTGGTLAVLFPSAVVPAVFLILIGLLIGLTGYLCLRDNQLRQRKPQAAPQFAWENRNKGESLVAPSDS